MANIIINNVKLVGISTCTPKRVEKNFELSQFSTEEIQKLIKMTGIEERRVSDEKTCTSDLCFKAAESLIEKLGWNKNDIDALVFVTQTPDYILPTTSSILQDKLGLSNSCMTLDVSSGCSGYINGIITLGQLMSGGNIQKGLLLVGDTISKICNPNDKSTYPLFGDAGTVTAFVYEQNAKPIYANIFTDGAGFKAIKIEHGGFRNQFSSDSLKTHEVEENIIRSKIDLELEGMDVFTFGITRAPECVNQLLESFTIEKSSVDFFVFHQANKFMNDTIMKKLMLAPEKVPSTLTKFGNTSSASIPLTICTRLVDKINEGSHKLVLCGFGVGLSWGCVSIDMENVLIPELLDYEY
jgi:3-oxoacyl-[acyl-carrier-protein] synthase-3